MDLLRWIRSSSTRSLAVATGALLLVAGAGLALRGLTHGTPAAERASVLLMASALVLAALVAKRSAFPRWSLVTAAAVFGAGLVVTTFLLPGADRLGHYATTTGTYGWLFLMMLGGAPVRGPRWCHSPWALVASAALLSVSLGVAQALF